MHNSINMLENTELHTEFKWVDLKEYVNYISIRLFKNCHSLAIWLRQLKSGLGNNLEGWGGEGSGRKVQVGGDMGKPMADSCWCLVEMNTILWSNHPSIKNTWILKIVIPLKSFTYSHFTKNCHWEFPRLLRVAYTIQPIPWALLPSPSSALLSHHLPPTSPWICPPDSCLKVSHLLLALPTLLFFAIFWVMPLIIQVTQH